MNLVIFVFPCPPILRPVSIECNAENWVGNSLAGRNRIRQSRTQATSRTSKALGRGRPHSRFCGVAYGSLQPTVGLAVFDFWKNPRAGETCERSLPCTPSSRSAKMRRAAEADRAPRAGGRRGRYRPRFPKAGGHRSWTI